MVEARWRKHTLINLHTVHTRCIKLGRLCVCMYLHTCPHRYTYSVSE